MIDTLTAEQVREVAESNSRQYESPVDDGVWLTEYDWQAIADELNALLGRETCSMKELTRYDGSDPHYQCNACGSENYEDDLPAYCPRCGKKVE